MIPVFTIIGRPNVGKSTLFNYLTGTREALVADLPGVTRDRQYGTGVVGERPYIVVDTGGIAEPDDHDMAKLTEQQVDQAIEEADQLLFMVDAKTGLVNGDYEIANRLRNYANRVTLVVNKVDRNNAAILEGEFYRLGFNKLYSISSTAGRGVNGLVENLLTNFPENEPHDQDASAQTEKVESIDIAVVGRPNVGKSTLINRILGEERVVVFDRPGTTRDSISIPFERRGKHYTLIDTAGVRRRSKIRQALEKFSVIKTMQAMQRAHVVILVIDAQSGLADQDLRLLNLTIRLGRAVLILINKWDGLNEYQRQQIKSGLDRKLQFINYARRYFISALHGTGVGNLYRAIDEVYGSATKSISTADLTKALLAAIKAHQPPLVRGRRIKLRYAHLGGNNPLTIIIHGKQISSLPGAYKRYLANYFRENFNLVGVPLILEFKQDLNPYVS